MLLDIQKAIAKHFCDNPLYNRTGKDSFPAGLFRFIAFIRMRSAPHRTHN